MKKHALKTSAAAALLIGFLPQSGLVTIPAFAQEQTTEQQATEDQAEKPKKAEKKARKEKKEKKQDAAAEQPAKPAQEAEKAEKKAKKEKKGKKQDAAAEQPAKPAQEAEKAVQQPKATSEQPSDAAEQQPATSAKKAASGDKQKKKSEGEPGKPRKEKAPASEASTEPAKQPRTAEPADPTKKPSGKADAGSAGSGKMTAEEARKEAETPVTVSEEAAKPKEIVSEPIEQQVQEAERRPAAVVPDEITDNQRKQLRAAERKRREDARNNRDQLLGAAAAGAIVGAVVGALGGRVAADEGDRLVIDRDGRLVVLKDESSLLRGRNVEVEYENLRGGYTREIITRPNGVKIISVRDPGGYVVRRIRVGRNGNRRVLFGSDDGNDNRRGHRNVPRYSVDIPRDRYIVSARRANRQLFRDTFAAEPVYQPEERYSLVQIREDQNVRAMTRRVDLDTITFGTGSSLVSSSQVRLLGDLAGGMLDVIDENAETVFMIEGHTDAVGDEVTNLVLSDRRAESVARILIDAYDVPPENLVTQGYGERDLKVDTEEAERANRRVAIRNITPILQATSD